MAHTAADGSKWTNAAQARKVPGRAQGDGKQPVARFSKPEPARASTAEPVEESPAQDQDSVDAQSPEQVVASHGPAQEVTVKHEGNQHTVTSTHADGHKHHSKHASAEEAHQAAGQLAGAGAEPSNGDMAQMNPAQAMM